MVTLVQSSSIEYREKTSFASVRTSSIDASYSDPDLLIGEYFLSSLTQRAISRKIIIQHIKTLQSIFAILSWGASGKTRDSYDGAVNLLSEISNLELLRLTCQAVEKPYAQMIGNPSTRVFAENFLEILIKAIACAYKVDAGQRLRLLTTALPETDERMIKASIIDALIILSDEADQDAVKAAIAGFSSDQDEYIRDYAAEALQDIG